MICCFLLIFHLLLLICFLINFSIYINNRYHFMLILLHHWSKRLYVMIFVYRMLIHVVWYQLLIFNWHYQLNMNLSVFCLKYCNHKQIYTDIELSDTKLQYSDFTLKMHVRVNPGIFIQEMQFITVIIMKKKPISPNSQTGVRYERIDKLMYILL